MARFLNKLNNPGAFIVVVVLFLALNGFLFYRYQQQQQQSLPSVGSTQPAAETYPAADEGSTDPSPAQEATIETEEDANSGEAARTEEGAVPSQEEALRTVVSVVEAPSWLSIQVDGESVQEGVSEPGFSRQFEADREVSISTGDAGAVLVEVNGYSLGPLGASGEAAIRTFTVGA